MIPTAATAAQAGLALDAQRASRAAGDALRASRAGRGGAEASSGREGGQAERAGAGGAPDRNFGKILDRLTPEKAQAAGLDGQTQKTVAVQAQNKRFSPGPNEEKKLQEACEGFEAVFIGQMLKEMRKSVPKDGMLHGKYEEQYVSMFDEELSKTLARQGGIGLAGFMKSQLALRGAAKNGNPAGQPGQAGQTGQAGQPGGSGQAGQQGQDGQLGQAGQAAENGQPVSPARGLRSFASETAALPAANAPRRGLRDQGLKPLRGPGAPTGPDAPPVSDASRPGAFTGRLPSSTPLRPNGLPPSFARIDPGRAASGPAAPGSLAGTASQHLGLPGARYLQGADAALAAGGVEPVSGELTSNFGWRRDPFTGARAWHGGMDIAAPEGTPVKAWRDGVVSFSGRGQGYGNYLVVDHPGGVQTVYGHNRENTAAEGQMVKAGQVIARVGQTGRATGPHLHFEVRVAGEAVDPAKAGGSMIAAAPDRTTAVPAL